ncbi:MAG: aminotransferase class V-fold PLP-dependent enzyme [Anaerolineales bacterium]|nr:aminotransferase class V-fold PLP-dependent enzyme [Anaerolineales bacterium]
MKPVPRKELILSSYSTFLKAFPEYASTALLDELRAREYARLDATQQVYLDFTGGGLYAESQLVEHHKLLSENVFGNPHSHNPTSQAMTCLVDQARAFVLEYFNASPDEYVAIFTQNASGALKLVGESYPFGPGDHYLLTFDNHNSVNGIREYARRKGAAFTYVPVVAPELRLDDAALARGLALARPGAHNLFAFPAQSNFSGVQHPLELIARAHDQGWDVLLDAAAFAPSNRLDLARWQPDFVPLSFYKMFGYPTGLGCLLARRGALEKLKRPWYAGGTITISSVQGDGHFLVPGEAGFEDGTVNYLGIPAVEIGLRYLQNIGMEVIHTRVACLAGWLIQELSVMHHANGQALIHLHGPANLEARGGTVTASFFDPNGAQYDDSRIEELANHAGISLRTGCFCNPGAGEVAHGLTPEVMHHFFQGQAMSFQELRQKMRTHFGREVSAVRMSVGLASNFTDVQAMLTFAAGLLDRTVEEIGSRQASTEALCSVDRDSA